jgi:hypothetical protein
MPTEKADESSLHPSARTVEHMDPEKSKADPTSDPRDTPEWISREKKLVRKLDLTLMPMVWVLYMFNYLDRNNIA